DGETRRLLLRMSPATIGRLLAGEQKRYRLHGISHTRSASLGGRIPIQTCMDPPLGLPGALAVDLVGHDGGQAVGDFNWTLTVTDRSTGWTEAGAVRTKAEIYVVAALETCLHRYPGLVISLHADNGTEFMNGHLVRFCHTHGITLTRSRPYHKNDNAHVEEKNNSVIRKFVGYDRHDTQEEVDLLNRLYRSLHLLVNWFLPSQKLLSKVRTGSHITKVYDAAQTPCTRMLARMEVAEETKKRLVATRTELDLASLHHEILHCQEQLDEITKRRQPLVIKKHGNHAYISHEFTT
ncbi:MAG: transposase family protein, partial [Candidatus Cryosericum sp.]